MNTHNLCFRQEVRKNYVDTPLLIVAMVTVTDTTSKCYKCLCYLAYFVS